MQWACAHRHVHVYMLALACLWDWVESHGGLWRVWTSSTFVVWTHFGFESDGKWKRKGRAVRCLCKVRRRKCVLLHLWTAHAAQYKAVKDTKKKPNPSKEATGNRLSVMRWSISAKQRCHVYIFLMTPWIKQCSAHNGWRWSHATTTKFTQPPLNLSYCCLVHIYM